MIRIINHRPLDPVEILRWADAYHEATGDWPKRETGSVTGVIGESWGAIDRCLRSGQRGLAGGSSLALFLAEHRRVRHIHALPPLSEEQILAWADGHQKRTGAWPTPKSGFITDDEKEKWSAIDTALRTGIRGLPGGSSLPKFLEQQRGVRNRKALPPLTVDQILRWADAHQERLGGWPNKKSGFVHDAPGETWMAVEMALSHGQRGLPSGSSLAMLLAEHRGIRNRWTLPEPVGGQTWTPVRSPRHRARPGAP
jgi:hypothetical protein